MSARPRLTPHQRYYLDALTRRSKWAPRRRDGYLLAADIGGKQVWMRLYDKGYIDISSEYDPRGGHRLLVRLKEI